MWDNCRLFLFLLVIACLSRSNGFSVRQQQSPLLLPNYFSNGRRLSMTTTSEEEEQNIKNSTVGDPLREATKIRPSLHPTTINAISEALKQRAFGNKDLSFRISETVKPFDVALTAGKIASTAITKRRDASKQDGMILYPEEEQTIAGRVMGVIMRIDDLELTLMEKVEKVGWVAKYNEWGTFGVLQSDKLEGLDQKIKDDPLFCMNRAECLLALFVKTVEIPSLEKAGMTVIDESKIDFLDEDRLKVLLSA
jgi:hypothetical protein